MKILVNGATGNTGRKLVAELINRGHHVTAIVRSPHKLPLEIRDSDQLSVIHESVLDLSNKEIAHCVKGCGAVASCLGHSMSAKGIWGAPRRLVAEATRRFCRAIKKNNSNTPTKFVLMNTAGFHNPDQDQQISFAQKFVLALLRLTLPPHADNEEAANYLRREIGQNDQSIEWAVVRPDNLTDDNRISEYEVYDSPNRSALFDAGETSRINVAHFMADLIADDTIWDKWRGQMPVIYNKTSNPISGA
ncbi:SDR family oxidoreductase [Aliifodinibius sp. S!AR15-10]|uniref:NAD(P)-dependent oxidoreductase n=1 Tax=Aliifodinibius sp. S!AR15-10 TaxID=2950437 RepID=UPI002855E1D6|nr:NAD(P)-binding oxidoreductase [Aliifodinibius sp. S!AR15-10]MDR8393980.1 SDR family oxidoreductase [Aliifodinibius sp. S!AR15-10]